MKLRNLAALLFRILGALFILTGFGDTLSEIVSTGKLSALAVSSSGLLVGILFIAFSKKLAALFCRGLDDDPS